MIRSTIDSGITGSLRCRHSAGIQETPPFNYATSSDGAVVGVRCGVVLMAITSTGLRSTGGSLSQGFRSVRSCSALLFGDRGARYGVVVWSGVDVLTNFLPVVRGAVVPVVVVWSGVDVLTDSLPASRLRRKDAPRRWAVRHRKLDAPYRLTSLPCGGPARLDPSLELNQGDPPCSTPPWPPGPQQGWAACSDRFWLRELRVSQHFSTFYEPSVQAMDTQINAPSTLPVLARTVSGCVNSAFLNILGDRQE